MKNKKEEIEQKGTEAVRLIPGSFAKCSYCDEYNNLCTKYDIPRYGVVNYIGEYTWENYCLRNGGCDR